MGYRTGKVLTAEQGIRLRLYQRTYYAKHRERLLARAHEYYGQHKDRDRVKVKIRGARYVDALKESAINMYSNGEAVCKWCGQGDMDVLCLDHIENNGSVHRKTIHTSGYAWVRRHDYPYGFQVLCLNCNWKKQLQKTAVA